MSSIVISVDHSRLVNSFLLRSTMDDATLPRMYPMDPTAIGMNTIATAFVASVFGVISPNPMVL